MEGYRRGYDATLGRLVPPPGTVIEERRLGSCRTLRITADGVVPERTILWFHGGGYMCGNPEGVRDLAGRLAVAARAEVLAPDYRLAPEHPFPAAVDDGLASYVALLAEGAGPGRLVVGGDSAGGGLALATVVAARDAGHPVPAGLITYSGLFDLSLSGATLATRAAVDEVVSWSVLRLSADAYLAGRESNVALASPLFADLTGVPSMLLQVGANEVLLDDSVRMARLAGEVRTPVRLEIEPHGAHVFQLMAEGVPRAQAAVERSGAFAVSVTSGDRPPERVQ